MTDNKIQGMIEQKARALADDPASVDKALRQMAGAILANRLGKRFHKDAYSMLFKEKDIRKRRFLNIGPGSFRHPFWRTADKNYGNEMSSWTELRRGIRQDRPDYFWDAYDRSRFPENGKFFHVIYSSHVIEHLFDDDAMHLLSECYRIMAPGGVLRIVCPDADLFAGAYIRRDWLFFLNYLDVKTGRVKKSTAKHSEKELHRISATFLLDWVSLIANKKNPKCLTADQCIEYLDGFEDIFEAFDRASQDSSRDLNMEVGAHVNWFNYSKLQSFLVRAGFTDICRSGYLQSRCPVLRDPFCFDKTDPEMSLFVEAVK